MSNKEGTNEIDWTVDEEIKLFYALRSHKPVGKCVIIFLDFQILWSPENPRFLELLPVYKTKFFSCFYQFFLNKNKNKII